MKNVIEFREYCFYRFYKSINNTDFGFWPEWRALGLLVAVDVLILADLFLLVVLITNPIVLSKTIVVVIPVIFLILNYYLFVHEKKWLKIITKFDSIPDNVQRERKWLFRLFLILIIGLLVLEFYLLYLQRNGSY